MDLFASLSRTNTEPIMCIDMHTCGEPTRIVVKGFPKLSGTLLEQRAQARAKYDHVRRRLMLEPRGHFDMYGAILTADTEMVQEGKADIGVLFTTNDGYSTMCGHATLALGRFLVDTHDLTVFPNRDNLKIDSERSTTEVRLHAPCGVVEVTVPTTADGKWSDATRPVSFISVESFATALNVQIDLPDDKFWPEGTSITADFTYGGAFYCLVPISQLEFIGSSLNKFSIDIASHFAKVLKATVNADPNLAYAYRHPTEQDLSFLYSVIIVDDSIGEPLSGSSGAEAGYCIFADQQVDRSPTGSAVSARLASAYAHGKLKSGDSWTYHSLVSLHKARGLAFRGTVVEEVADGTASKYPRVRTKVEGHASYTGTHSFIVEEHDPLGNEGFLMQSLAG